MELVEPEQFQRRKGFYDFTPRIIYKNSRTHEDSWEMAFYDGKLNHLWVDLFILDELPDSRLGSSCGKGFCRRLFMALPWATVSVWISKNIRRCSGL